MAVPPASSSAQKLLAAGALASRLPPILVRAQQVAASVMIGSHGRRRSGSGEDFWQFRPYDRSDSVQAIDWRQTAKADRAYVRDREWSIAQTVYLWRACGAGLAWQSSPQLESKQQRCDAVLLALALLLHHGGERLAFVTSRTTDLKAARTCNTPAAIAEQMMPTPEQQVPPPFPLPRGAATVLIGDWLAPLEEIEASLRAWATHGIRGHLVQVLDPAEYAFPFAGRTRFDGPSASAAPLTVGRAEDLRAAYQQRLSHHQAALADLCRALGWTFTRHHSDQPPQRVLAALYQALAAPIQGGGRR